MFISVDGSDGVGKSTQIAELTAWLRGLGHDVVTCRDPGSTPLGEKIRELLLDNAGVPLARTAEMLLYMAARAQLVDEIIRPSLSAGKLVLCDRFLLANVVYQGYAGGLSVDDLWQVGRVATRGLAPDLTLVLDMPVEAAYARLGRQLDRMEQQGDDFRQRVRAGFLHAARDMPHVHVVSADRPREQVQAELRQWVLAALARRESAAIDAGADPPEGSHRAPPAGAT